MPAARPLRDVFTDLLGQGGGITDPGEALRASGHADLPDGLAAEAVVNFADTAPVEVAEHLAPFVAANSPLPQLEAGGDGSSGGEVDEPLSWLEALTSAPVVTPTDPGADLDAANLPAALDQTGLDQAGLDQAGLDQANSALDRQGVDDGLSDFGIGDLGYDPTDRLDAATDSDAGAGAMDPATLGHELPPLDGAPLNGESLTADPSDETPDDTPDEPFEG